MKIVSIFNGVVTVPHGITDLFHAHKYDNLSNLCKIYSGSIGLIPLSAIIEKCNHNIHVLDLTFLLMSICHFRHDMPEINKANISKLTLSTLLVLSSPLIGLNLFSLYMGLIHVPRHYVKCNKFVKPYAKYLIMSILILSIPGCVMFENIQNLDGISLHIVESIVIGHILYNEIYIDNKGKNKQKDIV